MIKQKGFTIVELLVVIVVLGILTSVTVVAFNGVQQRAKATAVGNALTAFAKAATYYKLDNGKYPIPYSGTVARACLANDAAQYPAEAPFTAGSCEYESGSQLATYNTGVMTALSKYMSSVPTFPVTTFKTDYYTSGFTIRGIEYYYNSYYDTVRFYFMVEGKWCPVGKDYYEGTSVVSTNNTTYCYYDLK